MRYGHVYSDGSTSDLQSESTQLESVVYRETDYSDMVLWPS
jgi:hypothetical protein